MSKPTPPPVRKVRLPGTDAAGAVALLIFVAAVVLAYLHGAGLWAPK